MALEGSSFPDFAGVWNPTCDLLALALQLHEFYLVGLVGGAALPEPAWMWSLEGVRVCALPSVCLASPGAFIPGLLIRGPWPRPFPGTSADSSL